VSADAWPRWAKRAVGLLAVCEFLTAVFLVNEFHPAKLSDAQKSYFKTLKAAPGTAVLDWPFCIASANVVITKELCPYYDRVATAYANRRFHEKATVSIYLSRAHPTQFKSWLDAGWEGMFSPDDPTRERSNHETRCFDEEQWQRFDALYRGNDFAGIQLWLDLIPDPCVAMFHERYGEPTAKETLPRFGRVEFIPRSSPAQDAN
jgi:hypothetical protein